jgi:DNA-binding NarL/FixJ family response regulator
MGLRGYKANAERQQKIAALRAKGMTLREIGEKFNPPLSADNVHRTLRQIARDESRACMLDSEGVQSL